jgi:ribosome-associated heat shock protein Hsp15
MARSGSPSSQAARDAADAPGSTEGKVRLDVWLDVACLFKTRSEAQRACTLGKVEVNGQRAKPHRELRVGDRLTLGRPLGRKQEVVVKRLEDRHVAKADARELYEDVTPPPTPEEQAFRDLLKHARPSMPTTSPDKRDRRLLRQMKEGRG